MSFDKIIKQINVNVDQETAKICRALEANGLRFCVDFGYKNAHDKLADLPPATEVIQ